MAPHAFPRMPISGSTALVGVLGDPVRHSLSPAMHNAALAELGLDWVYLALPAPASRFSAVVEALETLGCRGLNVTLPHKQAACALARELTPLAERLGAVNTLVPRADGGWQGANTDVEGFLAPLRTASAAEPWHGRSALVLGCGGSARAVVAALVELKLDSIVVAGRRAEALDAFCRSCASWAPNLQALLWPEPEDPAGAGASDLQEALAQSDLVVNTTPVGMAGADPLTTGRCPLQPAELEALRPGSWVYDLIYTPRPSQLLRQATARGCRSLDGLEMLVQQGAAALRLWSGVAEVPVDTMRRAACASLEARRP